jgi:putative membrane protein insertion efficiency factor
MKTILLFFVRTYQLLLSPLLGSHCRFAPSCSHYAQDAIAQHGALKGSVLATKRLLRCHPFAESKFDPVPTNLK